MGGRVNPLRLASLAPPLVPPQRGGGRVFLLRKKGRDGIIVHHFHQSTTREIPRFARNDRGCARNDMTTTQSFNPAKILQILVHNPYPSGWAFRPLKRRLSSE